MLPALHQFYFENLGFNFRVHIFNTKDPRCFYCVTGDEEEILWTHFKFTETNISLGHLNIWCSCDTCPRAGVSLYPCLCVG